MTLKRGWTQDFMPNDFFSPIVEVIFKEAAGVLKYSVVRLKKKV